MQLATMRRLLVNTVAQVLRRKVLRRYSIYQEFMRCDARDERVAGAGRGAEWGRVAKLPAVPETRRAWPGQGALGQARPSSPRRSCAYHLHARRTVLARPPLVACCSARALQIHDQRA